MADKFFVCFATGMADFMPNEQSYHSFETEEGLRYAVQQECEMWEQQHNERFADGEIPSDEFYAYEFRSPREGEDNWSQRLRIAANEDWCLDVIGMTADEYEREQGE